LKKHYQSKAQKKRAAKRAQRELKKRRRKNVRKGGQGERRSLTGRPHVVSASVVTRILAPSQFSLAENPEENLEFFSELKAGLRRGKPVDLDVSGVALLTADSLLYLIATLHGIRQQGVSYSIKGNLPNDGKCKELFIQSGFLKYVNHSGNLGSKKGNVAISMHKDTVINGSLAAAAVDFCEQHLGKNKSRKFLYRILTELMGNTYEHAGVMTNQRRRTWYAVGKKRTP